MQLANLQVARQSARQAQQPVALFNCTADVLDQDAQAVLRAGQEEAGAGFLNAAVVIQPGVEVGAIDAQAAPGLLEHGQGVGTGHLRLIEAFQRQVLAEEERRRLCPWALDRGRFGVAHGKTPRRLKLDGGKRCWLVALGCV
ncbi:hypothetical protein D9M69_614460 [compost metagenome]